MQEAGTNLGAPKEGCAVCWQAARGMGCAGSEPGGLPWDGGGLHSPAALGRCWEVNSEQRHSQGGAQTLDIYFPWGMYNPCRDV